MKAGQYFALTIGILFLIVGIAGVIPGMVSAPAADPEAMNLSFTKGYGYLMGIFPINLLHNFVHLTVGALGILASFSLGGARLYSGVLALFYGILTLMGLFPPTQSMFGLVPIWGSDVWLHAITAAIAAYFGFFATPNLADLGEQGTQGQAPSAR